MRYKNKIYCDCCGAFLRTLNENEMIDVKNISDMGGRLNCAFVCDECSKRNEKNLKAKFDAVHAVDDEPGNLTGKAIKERRGI